MAGDDFDFAQQPGCGVCPIALLPDGAWAKLLKQPFRKRHPVLFWVAVIFIAALILYGMSNLWDSESSFEGEDRIALVSITGPIMDVFPTLEWLRKLENNTKIKGILARVDSPGGGAAASQEIYAALKRLADKMPVAVSMGSTAASGGLMVSMAGQRIFANPSTVTGSIGVRMDIPQLQGLMQKIGVGQETLVTAPYKDAASYLHPLTSEDRAYLEKVLQNMHAQFVEIVAASRNMPKEKAAGLANGKIFTGQEAKELGLIDELGGMDDALAWLADKTGIPLKRKLFVKKESKSRLLEKLINVGRLMGIDLDSLLQAKNFSNIIQPIFLY